jgi:hypothetical protein
MSFYVIKQECKLDQALSLMMKSALLRDIYNFLSLFEIPINRISLVFTTRAEITIPINSGERDY